MKALFIILLIIGYCSKINNPVINCETTGTDNTIGSSQGQIEDTIIYNSSVDGVTNLGAIIRYDEGYANIPICVIMHGWSTGYQSISLTNRTRFAGYKTFVVVPGMRGFNGADSANDASAMGIYDIYDAVEYVIDSFANIVDPTKISIIGYSGGGGNVLAACCKFPDYWNLAVSYFGMSDYGYDSDYGWYQAGTGYSPLIDSAVGCTPSECLDKYRSRHTVEAINNYKSLLYLFHDPDDNSVSVNHSRRIDTARTACLYYYEDTIYEHGYPSGNDSLTASESFYSSLIRTNDYVPLSIYGKLRIIGYVKTRQFEIRLGNRDDEVADLQYNLVNRIFTIIPLTGVMDVNIIIGNIDTIKNISSTTVFDL